MSETGIQVMTPVRALTTVTVEAIEFRPPCWLPENWKDFTESLFFTNGVYHGGGYTLHTGDWIVKYPGGHYRVEKSSVFLGSTAYSLIDNE